MWRATMTLMLVVTGASAASALDYHDYFVGFSTEFLVSSDADVSPFFPDSLTAESVSFAATYGPAAIRPLRFRAGIGWFPQRPFRLFGGIELPIYEALNRSRARLFGVYFLGDVGVMLPLGWTAEASLAILVPTNALGGIRLGVGVNRQADLLVTLSMATGAYPIRSRR